jgi:ribosomal protein S18 acetylase RimI-like enzyme
MNDDQRDGGTSVGGNRRIACGISPTDSATVIVEYADFHRSTGGNDCSRLDHHLCGNQGAEIVGLLTLVVFRIPTGVRAWIEDVVVDESARGHGVGEALNRAALDDARRRGAKTVDLTSRPSRAAANRLYQRLGFVARETNVYRFTLDG